MSKKRFALVKLAGNHLHPSESPVCPHSPDSSILSMPVRCFRPTDDLQSIPAAICGRGVDSVDRDLPLNDSARFRLVRKGRITEFYLNDYLMQCYSLPEQGTGRLGLIGPTNDFRELRAWYCR